jgi:hypothetical protein
MAGKVTTLRAESGVGFQISRPRAYLTNKLLDSRNSYLGIHLKRENNPSREFDSSVSAENLSLTLYLWLLGIVRKLIRRVSSS